MTFDLDLWAKVMTLDLCVRVMTFDLRVKVTFEPKTSYSIFRIGHQTYPITLDTILCYGWLQRFSDRCTSLIFAVY